MSPPAAAATAAPAKVTPQSAIVQIINHYKPVIGKLLARTDIGEETFIAQIANAMRANPTLWDCEPETVLGAALRCAQLGMPPNDGTNRCWIIPYGRRAAFQLGYGGVLELARRAEPGLLFDGAAVYIGDEFEIDLGNVDKPLTYRPAFARTDKTGRRMGRRGDAYAWWVRARYPDGRSHVHALDRDAVEYHRAFSKQPNGEMWTKSYDAAALKSVVLDMRRWLPLTPQLAAAQAADGQVVDVRDIDPDQPELSAAPEPSPDDEADAEWVAEAQS
jgi:recombination protein RecT